MAAVGRYEHLSITARNGRSVTEESVDSNAWLLIRNLSLPYRTSARDRFVDGPALFSTAGSRQQRMPVRHHGARPVNRRVRGAGRNTAGRNRCGRSFRRSGSNGLILTLSCFSRWGIWISARRNNTSLVIAGASKPPIFSLFGVSAFNRQPVSVCNCC